MSIKPASYVPSGDLKELFAPLQKRHDARIAKDKDFQYLQEDIAEMRKLRKENAISLNEAVRRKERDTQDARAKLREARLAAQAPADDATSVEGKDARSKVPAPTKPAKSMALKGVVAPGRRPAGGRAQPGGRTCRREGGEERQGRVPAGSGAHHGRRVGHAQDRYADGVAGDALHAATKDVGN